MLITNSILLQEECQKIIEAKVRLIAIDTEFINKTTGPPQLCLVQLAYEDRSFCVDILAKDINLSPLAKLFVNADILKVFHDCRQDIIALYPIFRIIPYPILDTQIGAMMCKYYEDYISYARVVKDFLNISLDKSLKRSNWKKRPLSPAQMNYVIADVTYLYKLAKLIIEILQPEKRLTWVLEEGSNIFKELSEKLKLYNDLYNLRETIAMEQNTTATNIASDVNLYKLSKLSFNKTSYIKNIVKHTTFPLPSVLSLYSNYAPCNVEVNPKVEGAQLIIVFAYSLLISLALKAKISSKLIGSLKDISELLYKKMNKQNLLLYGWRYEHFGRILENFFQKNNKIELINKLIAQAL